MRVDVKMEGLEGVLDTLKSLPPEVVSKRGGPVKTAVRKGALVILKQAKINLNAVTNNGDKESTGLLLANLVASRGRLLGGQNGERYLVRVRKKRYPRKGKTPVVTSQSGRLLEYGSSQQPAEPWMRPAFLSKAPEAIKTMETELLRGIDRVVKRLAAQNKAK